METVLWLKSEASVREGADAHIANLASVNGLIHALRGIAREAFKLEFMTGDNYERIRLVPLIRYRRIEAGRAVRPADLTHLVRALLADGSTGGARCTAMLAVLYTVGLRRARHADPSTTQRYDRRGEEHVRASAHDVHFPYAVNADPSPSEKVSASSREANPSRTPSPGGTQAPESIPLSTYCMVMWVDDVAEVRECYKDFNISIGRIVVDLQSNKPDLTPLVGMQAGIRLGTARWDIG